MKVAFEQREPFKLVVPLCCWKVEPKRLHLLLLLSISSPLSTNNMQPAANNLPTYLSNKIQSTNLQATNDNLQGDAEVVV